MMYCKKKKKKGKKEMNAIFDKENINTCAFFFNEESGFDLEIKFLGHLMW